jgi:hypothetical protein
VATEFKRFQVRGNKEEELLVENGVPLDRELVVATDTRATWIGDGVTPIQSLPKGTLAGVGPEVYSDIANDIADPGTDIGAAVAAVVASSGGGGASASLTYDPATGAYSIPVGSTINYDPATGAYSSN